MLKFPANFVEEEDAERLIEKNINDLLLDIVSFTFEHFDDDLSSTVPYLEYADNNRETFGRYLNEEYDLPFKPENTFRICAGLYCLLNSKKKYIPTLRMERLMAHLIIAANETNKMVESLGDDPPYEQKFEDSDREVVLKALRKELESCEPDERDYVRGPKSYERPDDFLELCFWDDDWSFIDEYEKIDLPERWWEEEYRGEAQE